MLGHHTVDARLEGVACFAAPGQSSLAIGTHQHDTVLRIHRFFAAGAKSGAGRSVSCKWASPWAVVSDGVWTSAGAGVLAASEVGVSAMIEGEPFDVFQGEPLVNLFTPDALGNEKRQ